MRAPCGEPRVPLRRAGRPQSSWGAGDSGRFCQNDREHSAQERCSGPPGKPKGETGRIERPRGARVRLRDALEKGDGDSEARGARRRNFQT